jgi:2-keto-4-pentenoate hydratase/2-oxohepta-3-ene-1,7-dioic acid hydratase in catechol pathway
VISCGAPPGMTWMKHGDVCEVEIEGIGVLRNHVRDRR